VVIGAGADIMVAAGFEVATGDSEAVSESGRFTDPVRRRRKQNHVPLPLVVSFAVIMVGVMREHVPERGLAE